MRPLLAACVLAALLVVDAPRSTAVSGFLAAQAVGQLGPLGAWHCLSGALYRYDPRRDRADRGLVLESPESIAEAYLRRSSAPARLDVERVEVGLRGGDTAVWARLNGSDGEGGERRVVMLSPGAYRDVAVDVPGGAVVLCRRGLQRWEVVGEHGLPSDLQ